MTLYDNVPRQTRTGETCEEGLRTNVNAGRKLTIASTVVTGSGTKKVVVTQDLSFRNSQLWSVKEDGQVRV